MRYLGLLLLTSSCICFQAEAPHDELKGVVVDPNDPQAGCLDVMLAICEKAEACQAEGWEHCWSALAPQCKAIDGITEEDAVKCSKAISQVECTVNSTPPACQGIGQPKPKSPILGLPAPK